MYFVADSGNEDESRSSDDDDHRSKPVSAALKRRLAKVWIIRRCYLSC